MAPKNEISDVLKRIRKQSGISVADAVNALNREYSIKISTKTLYGYESGLSMPNADVFVALCKIYGCDNPIVISDDTIRRPLRPDESHLLGNYNLLNDNGKDKAQEYVEDLSDNPKYTEEVWLNAAHQRTDTELSGTSHDDDIMDDPAEWEDNI